MPIKVLPRGEGTQMEVLILQYQVHRTVDVSTAGAHSCVFQLFVLIPHTKPFCIIMWFLREDTALAGRGKYSGFLSMCFNLPLKEEIRILAYPRTSWSFRNMSQYPQSALLLQQ